MADDEWKIYLRDPNLQRQGEIGEYSEAVLNPKYRKLGTWSLTMAGDHPKAIELAQPGMGIEVTRNGNGVFSGIADIPDNQVADQKDTITITGFDDMIWLQNRLAHPDPTNQDPPYTNEFDVRGPAKCSTILRQYVDFNAGPSALGRRRKSRLQIAADPLIGDTITCQARWGNLLSFLETDVAIPGSASGDEVGYRVRQDGQVLWYEVFSPRDHTGTVKLSTDLGTMASYGFKGGRPKANYWYAGGSGEGAARLIREGQDAASILQYDLIETFLEQSDAGTNALLDQAINGAKQSAGAESTLTLVPADVESMAFFDDYYVGDRVTAAVNDTLLTQLITEARISLSGNGVTVEPVLGTPSSNQILMIFRRLLALERVVSRQQRR